MKTSHEAAAKRQRAATEQIRTNFTDYALAGMRRSHYAGVFRKIEGAVSPTFLAVLELDGFERRLEIKVTARRDKAGKQYLDGLLSGLSLLSQTRRFELTRDNEGAEKYSGTIKLHGSCLVINILPTNAVNGDRVNLCHLEVLRETPETGGIR